jgi:hypothetical protein
MGWGHDSNEQAVCLLSLKEPMIHSMGLERRAVRRTVYGYGRILYGCHTVYGYCMTYRIMYSTSVNGTVRLD